MIIPPKGPKVRALMPDETPFEFKAPETAEQKSAAAVPERTTNEKTADAKKTTEGNEENPSEENSFVPGQHGLMITMIGHRDGKPNQAIQKLYASLVTEFGIEHPLNAVMIELAVVDYWRLGQGHLAEKRLIDSNKFVFEPKHVMPTIIRYNATARRNLEKSLELLQKNSVKAAPKSVGADEDAGTSSANYTPAPSHPASYATHSDEVNNPPADITDAA